MRCVSLFSGAGGLDLGLAQAGFDIDLAVDTEPICADSYRANFDGASFFQGSVTELTLELMSELTGGRVKDGVDLLVGGPPCPPYSKSRFYRKEKPRALQDDLGLETISGYLSVLQKLHPRAFLLENVPGLAYGPHREALDLILDKAGSLGYACTWRVLNAADYGVPQIRERLFVVGMLDGVFEFPAPTHAKDPTGSLLDGDLAKWRTAGDAINDLDTEENADDTGHFAGGKHHDLLRQIPPGENYLFFTTERGHPNPVFKWRSRYWSFLLKLSPDRPSWTIQARRSNNMGPLHWRNRILRIEEIKRLQGFPDEWYLAGTIEQQWRQLGNAVPPPLARALGEALRDQLSKKERASSREWQSARS
jgi:DNA (cytosine-5)-methyltransferase 1